ncbi:MAG: hypothetical protein ACXVCD_15695, partial [Pseudobdellovibrionaceae bacterium]
MAVINLQLKSGVASFSRYRIDIFTAVLGFLKNLPANFKGQIFSFSPQGFIRMRKRARSRWRRLGFIRGLLRLRRRGNR